MSLTKENINLKRGSVLMVYMSFGGTWNGQIYILKEHIHVL